MGVFAVDFRGRARNWWGLRGGLLVSNRASFEGRRGRGKGQGAGVVQVGVDRGGNVGKRGQRRWSTRWLCRGQMWATNPLVSYLYVEISCILSRG
jgi:hypothetical protein